MKIIREWKNQKLKYLIEFKKIQDDMGSVQAGKLAKAIGKSRATSHTFLNYMMDNDLVFKPVDYLYKLTETGEQLYEQEVNNG